MSDKPPLPLDYDTPPEKIEYWPSRPFRIIVYILLIALLYLIFAPAFGWTL